jgi:hypothetical protein
MSDRILVLTAGLLRINLLFSVPTFRTEHILFQSPIGSFEQGVPEVREKISSNTVRPTRG